MHATFLTERLLDMSKKKTMSYRALALIYIRLVLHTLGHLSGTLPPKMKTYKSVRGFKVGLLKILTDK